MQPCIGRVVGQLKLPAAVRRLETRWFGVLAPWVAARFASQAIEFTRIPSTPAKRLPWALGRKGLETAIRRQTTHARIRPIPPATAQCLK